MTIKLSGFQTFLCSCLIFNLAFSPFVSAMVKVKGQTTWSNINSVIKIAAENHPPLTSADQSSTLSINHLAQVMDQFHNRFPVYDDVSSAGNHFHAYAKLLGETASVAINGSYTTNPHSGATAIQCQFLTGGSPFGGYYFQNGILTGKDRAPQLNFGTVPNAGITELVNATTLTFWARGEVGGEKIDFFMGGVGRIAETGDVRNPCVPGFPELVRLPIPLHESQLLELRRLH